MKVNWRAYRVASVALATVFWMGGAIGALAAPTAPIVQVNAVVDGHSVRIEAKAGGPFEYTTYRPSESLFVVDLAGVSSSGSSGARVLNSTLVSSYRVLQYRSGEMSIVRLEVLMRTPVEPLVERQGAGHLTVSFVAKGAPLAAVRREEKPASRPAPEPAVRGTAIEGVQVARSDKQTEVRVNGNGRLNYETMRLLQPDRLVLDFVGAKIRMAQKSIPSDLDPVRGIRVGQFKPGVARVVIELGRGLAYSVAATGNSVVVSFGSPVAAEKPVPAETIKLATESSPVAPVEPVAKPAELVAPQTAVSSTPEQKEKEAVAQPISLPETLTQPSAVLASPAPAKVTAAVEPVASPTPAPEPAAPAPTPQGEPAKQYSGEPISVNLKDVDLKDFFRLIHEISGLNVVVDPGVRGTLTIVLDDVPWDQALEIVLRNNNLDKQLEGNVLRLATRDTLKREAEARRDLVKAQAEAVDQITTTRVLSYAKASALRDTLKRFLSSRGEILSDDRSNTLIIRDIPTTLPAVDNLIAQLDRKSQQVEIEARVVAATRSFERDIGTQFGFATSSTSGRSVYGGIAGAPGFTSPVQRGSGLPRPPLVSSGTSSIPLNTNLPAVGPSSGFTFAHASPNFALDFIITALEKRGVGKLLSKPKVITQNNETAIVKQGTKIPIQTVINNTISVTFIDAVLKLEVTPQITAENTVFMDVVVENTAIDPGIPRVTGIPALTTQEARTKVLINDGGTVVIGGVIISSQQTNIEQVPLLGSIPLIGHLFKKTRVSTDSKELLFFITPRIVPS